MNALKSKLVIVFKGEEGVDIGGVRLDFFTHLFHRFEKNLTHHRACLEGEPGDQLSKMEYAAGVFSGIAITQDGFLHPVMIELIKLAGPRFLEGLNLFVNLVNFLSYEKLVHILFERKPITTDQLITLLRRVSHDDSNLETVDKINFNFICKFFNDVHGKSYLFPCKIFFLVCLTDNTFDFLSTDRVVSSMIHPITLEDILHFLTGKRIIPPWDETEVQI